MTDEQNPYQSPVHADAGAVRPKRVVGLGRSLLIHCLALPLGVILGGLSGVASLVIVFLQFSFEPGEDIEAIVFFVSSGIGFGVISGYLAGLMARARVAMPHVTGVFVVTAIVCCLNPFALFHGLAPSWGFIIAVQIPLTAWNAKVIQNLMPAEAPARRRGRRFAETN